MNKIIVYDFDGTLTPYSIPKFEILEKCGVNSRLNNIVFMAKVFFKIKNENIDFYNAIYKTILETIKSAGFKLKDDNFKIGYDKIVYNNGVFEFLEMLHKNNIDNYLISSGIKVFLDNTAISKYFKDIYATTFYYDDKSEACDINFLMSDKNKVTAIKDILCRNNINELDCSKIIYIGDGLTDYYAMEYVKTHGGTTIFVYSNKDSKDVLDMKKKNVVSFYTKNDFSYNTELYKFVKTKCKIK